MSIISCVLYISFHAPFGHDLAKFTEDLCTYAPTHAGRRSLIDNIIRKKFKDFLGTAWWLSGALLCHSQTLQTVSLPSARCMLGQHHCQPDQEWEGLLRGSANETFPSSFSRLYAITLSTTYFDVLFVTTIVNIIDFSNNFSLMWFCKILNNNHTRANHTKERLVSRSWEQIKTTTTTTALFKAKIIITPP